MTEKSYGEESQLSYLNQTLAENRYGLIAAMMITHLDGGRTRELLIANLHQDDAGDPIARAFPPLFLRVTN
ncbi:MAG: hypothetical protein WBD10_05035 [Acidobacteriaceae bacterium]